MSPVLVTGGSGFLGSQLIVALLREGRPVRTTLRSRARADDLHATLRRGGADPAGVEIAVADLTTDDGWAAALDGCEEVHHVASPIPLAQPDDPDDLIVPAREGTLRVLRAARDAGARRVVLTSSFAAVGYSPKANADYDERDWTDPDSPGLNAYVRSKAIAERAAWDFVAREGDGLELVSVNPTGIFGPTLTPGLGTTLHLVASMLDGTMETVPRQFFGVADVRDVADLHVRAMASDRAAGERFLALADEPPISWLELAAILARRLGPLAARVPTQEAPGPPLARPTIRNAKARDVLGWRPRPLETTIVETAQSLAELGLLRGA